MAMAVAQKDMVAGPDAMAMSVFRGMIVAMRRATIMPVIMGMTMRVTMPVRMTMKSVVVCHDRYSSASSAQNR